MSAGADDAEVVRQRAVRDHDPTRAAAERHHRRTHERLPRGRRAELRDQGFRELTGRLAVTAEILEVALVPEHHVRVGQLALSERADLKPLNAVELALDKISVRVV